MKHLDKWERQLGNRYVLEDGERMLERNEGRRLDLECRYEGCGKVCKSKGGLVQHQKLVHRAPLERVRFECRSCGLVCETEVACLNHERSCGGGGWRRIEGSVMCAVVGWGAGTSLGTAEDAWRGGGVLRRETFRGTPLGN